MDNKAGVRQLDECRVGQRQHHRRKLGEEAPIEIVVGDVADRYEYEPVGSSRQEVAAQEICVFGHDDAAVKVCKAANVRVWRAVAVGKIQRVDGVVPGGAQAAASRRGNCASTRNFTLPAAGRA